MKEKQTSIQWCLNIILIFLIACRFSPVSNDFTSSLFTNVMSGYLVIILNILISKYAENCDQGKTNKLAIIFNCILATGFICSVAFDFSKSETISSIVQVLLIVCSYLACYFIVMKFGTKKYIILVLALSLINTLIVSEVQYGHSLKQMREEHTSYTFDDEDAYKHFKKRYKLFGKYMPYSVLNHSNDSVYVQDLMYGQTEYFSFETQSEKDDFVEKYTMGIGNHIPVMGPNAKFVDNEKTVIYNDYSVSALEEVIDIKRISILYFPLLMVVEALLFLVGRVYEKKNKNNGTKFLKGQSSTL